MRVYFISLLAILSFSLKGQEKINLNDAKKMLLENNIQLKQSELKEKISKINHDIAQYDITPTINFNVNNQQTMGLVFDQVSGKLITGNQWTNYANATISSTVVLYAGNSKINSIRNEKINHDISVLQTIKLKRDLVIEMVGLFFQTLINRDLYNASNEQLKFSTNQVIQLTEEVEIGRRTLGDIAQANSKKATDKLNNITSKNAYESSLLKLKQILDIPLEKDIEITAPNNYLSIGTTEYLLRDQDDPDLRILNKKLELSEIQIKLEKSKYLPSISFNTGYGTNFSSQRYLQNTNYIMPLLDQLNQNRSFYGIISLSFPIYNGFKTKSNIKKAKLDKQILSYDKIAVDNERIKVFSDAVLEYRAAREELIAVNALVEANKVNFEALNIRYQVGKSSSAELFKSLTDLNISEFTQISTRYKLMFRHEILKLLTNNK